MFVGKFEHSLDDKGRIVLPTALRDELIGNGFLGSMDNGCLALWNRESYSEFVSLLKTQVRDKNSTPDALRKLASSTTTVKPDSQGRIGVSAEQRAFAGLESGAVIIGAIDHIEFWSPERWEEVEARGTDDLAHAVNELGVY